MEDRVTSTSTTAADLYTALAAPFAETFKDLRGGVNLEYITGEQCLTRLNEVLGFDGWSFEVREHGINAAADEVWALGRLTVFQPIKVEFGGAEQMRSASLAICQRDQFGSQKIKRQRSSGTPLDIGFDLKGATTDALKKCAMSIGVGLYLSKKDPQPSNGFSRATDPPKYDQTGKQIGAARPARDPQDEADDALVEFAKQDKAAEDDGTLACAECGAVLRETKFRDGTTWPPSQLAGYGRRKHNRVLCMDDYRKANEARARAERSTEPTPF